ncbi:glycerophosphodiester phosphodiesterase GDPD2 isoform X2 [Physcomitrium patens]|uniref:glycerophosphodiester phosphodiesterase GDPD2 isoform X2 n=1 Tax=Physcomitrium patens TaxID=3218 RepID=UPI000D164F06|nr:glycerophosphodiester phosphodiesterase GDPD2-like isoform X2 [Physcomitrium patens]|eukprot:XP_024373071.1 glycerophosphodiester phosphodiesterase GDPD2-like isoform X2 [Physcomitrella patens]
MVRLACSIAMFACEVSEVALPVQDRHSQRSALETAFNASEVIGPVESDDRTNGANSMLVVVGHRGCGLNRTFPHGVIPESRPSVRENTITSFNLAARNGAQFVEFDVQVTKDGVPIIFHDDEIITEGNTSSHISDLTLTEFRAIGPQKDFTMGQLLYSRASDGSTHVWTADIEDHLCTLEEAFTQVEPTVGFNIELKFDDYGITADAELHRVIDAVLDDVRQYANGRVIYFSSFHPDAVQIVRKKTLYPVFFLTDGGTYTYQDPRKNSIEAAIEICREGNLQGIVSEVKAVLHRPASVALVKAAGLYFFTYGELNNLGEAVLKQREWGIDGVIVDHVLEVVRVAQQMEEPASPSGAALARRGVAVV